MRVFNFNGTDLHATFEEQGWVHIQGGIDPDFLAYLRRFVSSASGEKPLSGQGIRGPKEQHVLEFPEGLNWGRELFDVIASLCGLKRETMTLSERHIKAYQPDAPPDPPAHKDRFASQISVGLSVEVPEGSHLVLYPYDHREVNPFLSAGHRETLEPHELPEVILPGAQEVVIHDKAGDVVVFRGSSIWHVRRNAANTVMVYLKFNDFDCDPLGEDPATPLRRQNTLALLNDDDREKLRQAIPRLSRRFESVRRDFRREGWPERLMVNVWGQRPFPVSEAEFALLRELDGERSVGALADLQGQGAEVALKRLALRGAVDLLA